MIPQNSNNHTQHTDEVYMHRCIDLARRGAGQVAPNPMVGAVLVYKDRIIGEGFHQQYGQAHAEVNCIASVREDERRFIPASTIYVSLEPCAHHGKTPPCADLIIRNKIMKVVVGCRDPFEQVNGKGIEKLEAAGIEVIKGVLEPECRELNKRFFTFHQQHRPYIILKWAETADHKMDAAREKDARGAKKVNGVKDPVPSQRLLISNDVTNRLVHRWRSEEAAILVGSRTAIADDPSLTNRYWIGNNPLRLLIDKRLDVPATAHLLDSAHPTVVYNIVRNADRGNIHQRQLDWGRPIIPQILEDLHRRNILSVIIEGGSATLQHFIDAGTWDEARVIRNLQLTAGRGTEAPVLIDALKVTEQQILGDVVQTYIHQP